MITLLYILSILSDAIGDAFRDMKKLIFIFIFSCSVCHAQYFDALTEKTRPHPLRTVLTYSSSIALNAIGDGLNESGHKGWGHAANAVSISLIIFEPFLNSDSELKWYHRVATYSFIRFGIFDYTYLAVRGLPLNTLGNSSLTDKLLQKIKPPDNLLFGRAAFLCVGISMPFNAGKFKSKTDASINQ